MFREGEVLGAPWERRHLACFFDAGSAGILPASSMRPSPEAGKMPALPGLSHDVKSRYDTIARVSVQYVPGSQDYSEVYTRVKRCVGAFGIAPVTHSSLLPGERVSA